MAKLLDSDITVTPDEQPDEVEIWEDVCFLSRLIPERGIAALLGEHQVAIFRIDDESGTQLYAVDHIDPRMKAPTMARGLVGSVGDEPTVAAPLLKEKYSLVTGECLTDPQYSLNVFEVRVHQHTVQLRKPVQPQEPAELRQNVTS